MSRGLKALRTGALISLFGFGIGLVKLTAGPVAIPPEMQLAPLPAQTLTPNANPTTTAKVELGRLLFFDPILSSTRDVSCATCHHPRYGWGDGRSTPIGTGGVGIGPARMVREATASPVMERNTPSLLNIGFAGMVSGRPYDPSSAPMFWDGRVQGLEAQAIVPIRTQGELCGAGCHEDTAVENAVRRVNEISEYRRRFAASYGGSESSRVTAEQLAQVLAAFERSLVTAPSPFDRYLKGDASAISEEARQGMRVFETAGCIQCHGGPLFSDYKMHFIGVVENGRQTRRQFRTPTLRNLNLTAPYMHNGSQRTVRDVLVFYEAMGDAVSETLDGGDTSAAMPLDPLLKHLNLGADDFPALEAFLDSLNSEGFPKSIPQTVPSGLQIDR